MKEKTANPVLLVHSIRSTARARAAALGPWIRRSMGTARAIWRVAGYYLSLAALLILLGYAAYSYQHRPQRAAVVPAEVSATVLPETPVWQPEIALPPLLPSPTPVPFALAAPVPGEVLQGFLPDSLVWSPDLGQWQTHAGVDLSAEAGEAVCAAEAGEVIGAYRDVLLGNTIELRHDNGWITRYASLNTLNLVKPGQRVAKGEIIAAAGDSADAEAELGPHVHFELLIDGEPAAPDFAGQGQDP